jgi:sulfite exporter TauE/SafE
VFLAGLVNGLLPCGLVYAYLALAASSAEPWQGALTMAAFGLGTIPILALVGTGGHFLSRTARWRLLRLAAWCVVLTGVLSILRGISAVAAYGWQGSPECPLCR